MAIEQDAAEILSGVRHGETIGSPIALLIANRDWTNWQHTMSVDAIRRTNSCPAPRRAAVTRPRPGHADLSAGLKYDRSDLRDVLERASARETAARVAAGVDRAAAACCSSASKSPVTSSRSVAPRFADPAAVTFDQIAALDEMTSGVWTTQVGAAMKAGDRPREEAGDTVGGAFEVIASRRPARSWQPRALGSQTGWTTGAGLDVDSRHQSGRHWTRSGRRKPARLPGARRNCSCGRDAFGHACPGCRGRLIAPAASKVASPTVKTASRHRLDETDLDADEAAPVRGPGNHGGVAGRD